MIYLFSFFFHRRWNKSSICSSSTIQAVSLVASLERLVFSFFFVVVITIWLRYGVFTTPEFSSCCCLHYRGVGEAGIPVTHT